MNTVESPSGIIFDDNISSLFWDLYLIWIQNSFLNYSNFRFEKNIIADDDVVKIFHIDFGFLKDNPLVYHRIELVEIDNKIFVTVFVILGKNAHVIEIKNNKIIKEYSKKITKIVNEKIGRKTYSNEIFVNFEQFFLMKFIECVINKFNNLIQYYYNNNEEKLSIKVDETITITIKKDESNFIVCQLIVDNVVSYSFTIENDKMKNLFLNIFTKYKRNYLSC